jgi:hypothetical protein
LEAGEEILFAKSVEYLKAFGREDGFDLEAH